MSRYYVFEVHRVQVIFMDSGTSDVFAPAITLESHLGILLLH